jgi:hypothetical protein
MLEYFRSRRNQLGDVTVCETWRAALAGECDSRAKVMRRLLVLWGLIPRTVAGRGASPNRQRAAPCASCQRESLRSFNIVYRQFFCYGGGNHGG